MTARFACAVLTLATLCACTRQADPSPPSDTPARRIVSLDYCADQYVLQLADRERILAVSPDATKPFSYLREQAVGLPSVRPLSEDVLLLRPDLVVRSYGGGPGATAFFERAGIPVLQIGFAAHIDGESSETVVSVLRDVAAGLDEAARAEVMIDRLRARLAALPTPTTTRSALYMTPAGVTAGPGSLIHEMLRSAGLTNFQQAPGWRTLPLERLAYEQPDLIGAAFFGSMANHPDAWSAARHPIARRQLHDRPVVALPGAWTSCGGWFILDAIEALADGAAP